MNRGKDLFFVIMGVSGCGKTTVGKRLAARLGVPFHDADDFHPAENVARMTGGSPLNDADRAPWLARLAVLIRAYLDRNETAVLACSALKQRYREQLRVDDRVHFVFLDGDFDLIWARMQARPDHYMKPEMLRSQFAALEHPAGDEAIRVGIDRPVEEIIERIIREHKLMA